jgi:hypothetical protein
MGEKKDENDERKKRVDVTLSLSVSQSLSLSVSQTKMSESVMEPGTGGSARLRPVVRRLRVVVDQWMWTRVSLEA